MTRLFAAWGVDYNPNQVVFDASFATPINAGGSVVPHPVFLSLSGAVFAGNSPVSSTLRQMLIGEAGALAAKEGQGSTFEPLITTSSDSGTITAENAMVMMPQDLMRDMKPDGKGRVLAALVRGTFKSAFEERPGDKTKGEEKAKDKDKDKDEKEARAAHRASCTGECQMIVIADTDFLSNDSSVDTFRFGSQTLYRPRNDNLNFLYNAVDYLGGSDDLVAIRAKGRLARPFTRVLELQKSAQIKWQAEEERLTQELNELQKRLSELQAQRQDGGDNQSIATAQQDEITRFRDEERRVRGKRREVRKNLREDIEALGRKLIAWNMLGMPTMTSVLGAWVFFKRSRSRREVASTHERDKPSSP
jgi:ABC-type uncharacterized transport system involved in gliding motility auxiliary subunit